MDHPLIGSLGDLTTDELSDKLGELNKKLQIAYQMGNNDLIYQLRLAIANYSTERQNRYKRDQDTPFTEVINIQ